MTDEQIDALWLYRKDLHGGELMPQLRDFARALLSASKPAALDGWKLVPEYPTQPMRDAGNRKLTELATEPGMGIADRAFYAYNAMLAAVPAAPSAEAAAPSAIGEPVVKAAPELLAALEVLTSGRHMFSPTEFGGYVCKQCGGYPSDKQHFRIVDGIEENVKTDMEKARAAIAKAKATP